jgi:hypothetical protein
MTFATLSRTGGRMTQDRGGKRRSLRRAVALECCLQSELWDDELRLPASNLSTEGVWIETPIALAPGDEVIVSFTPPGLSADHVVWAAAKVVRVATARRQGDQAQSPGMALRFTYCSDPHRRMLARSLLGVPPRLPLSRVPPPLPQEERASASSA